MYGFQSKLSIGLYDLRLPCFEFMNPRNRAIPDSLVGFAHVIVMLPMVWSVIFVLFII